MTLLRACFSYANQPVQSPYLWPARFVDNTGVALSPCPGTTPEPGTGRIGGVPTPQHAVRSFQLTDLPACPVLTSPSFENHDKGSVPCSSSCLLPPDGPGASPCGPAGWGMTLSLGTGSDQLSSQWKCSPELFWSRHTCVETKSQVYFKHIWKWHSKVLKFIFFIFRMTKPKVLKCIGLEVGKGRCLS